MRCKLPSPRYRANPFAWWLVINLKFCNYNFIKSSIFEVFIYCVQTKGFVRERGIVFRAEDYKYSSACDYTGEKGILDDVVIYQYFKL